MPSLSMNMKRTDITRGQSVVHILFMFILNEGISPWFCILGVVDHLDALHRPVLLKLSSKLALTSVKVDPCSEESFKRISHGRVNSIWIPKCNFLFQLIRNLLSFFSFSHGEVCQQEACKELGHVGQTGQEGWEAETA